MGLQLPRTRVLININARMQIDSVVAVLQITGPEEDCSSPLLRAASTLFRFVVIIG